MIDGVKIVCNGTPAGDWLNNSKLNFGVVVSDTTGEILGNYKEAKTNGLDFRIYPNSGVCALTGSLHRFNNAGGENSNLFDFAALCGVVDTLQQQYSINPAKATISRLEIGVNIPLEYSPEIIIKSAICYKSHAPATLCAPHTRRRIGRIWDFYAYSVKLYDKGNNILRFEIAYHNSREFSRAGVRSLEDLTTPGKYSLLFARLLSALQNFIFYDFKYNSKDLTPAARRDWILYQVPAYWENLTKHARTKAIPRYWRKVDKYGAINWRKFLLKKCDKIWYDLTRRKRKKRLLLQALPKPLQAQETATFAKLGLIGAKVATTNGRGYLCREETPGDFPGVSNATISRRCYCASCGRDITEQKAGSRFCSVRLFGPIARKCRNKDSNRRLTLKRKINKAMKENKFIAITYEYNGNLYTDILTPAEITQDRATLDRVREIKILTTPPETMKNRAAVEYLKRLNDNEKDRNENQTAKRVCEDATRATPAKD